MNLPAPTTWPARRAPALGVGISLLVHALAVAWLLHAGPASPPLAERADAEPARRIAVRLIPMRPPAPPPSVHAAPVPATAIARAQPVPPARRPRARIDDPADARAAAPARTREAEPPATPIVALPAAPSEAPSAPSGDAGPAIDMAAARSAARRIGREHGKGLVATRSGRPDDTLQADERAQNALERARRIDCSKARANSTNLLANVVLLAADMVKNAVDDSGCKW